MDTAQPFPTPPNFDHVFVVVSAETFNAIQDCRFLADGQLGRFFVRESESSLLGRYKPIRIFGKNTLIEIFQDKFGDGEFVDVNSGVVVSFDYPGEALTARQRLTDRGIEFRGGVITRMLPNEPDPIAWYLSTRPDTGPRSPLALFLSEMDTAYLKRIGVRLGEDGQQNRSAHFEAVLRSPHPAELLMQDVVAVTLRLHADRVRRVVNVLTAVGYDQSSDGQTVRLRGPDGEVRLQSDDSAVEGALELEIKLARPAPEPGLRFDFGSASSLVLSPGGADDDRAIWSFVPRARGM